MSVRTAEEAKQNYIAVMGDPLGSLFHSLWQEVAWLFRRWDNYVELFASKPSRVDLLNEAAPGFFSIVQHTLWEAVLLHIARLTDPPNSAGKANLTIQRLHTLVGDASVAQNVKQLTEKAIAAASFSRDWRNRRIAHSDLSLAVDPHPEPLEPASREKVRLALSALVEVLNPVTQHYMDTSNVFDLPGYHGDAGSLLYVLDDGVRAEAERHDRLKRGEVRDDDFRRRDL